jgi:vancomycin resistance protein YoaR
MFKEVLKDIKKKNFSWKRIIICLTIFLFSVFFIFLALFFYTHSFDEKVFPGIYLGDIHIGAMDRGELTDYIQKMENKLSDQGIKLSFDIEGKEEKLFLYPNLSTEDFVENLIEIDIRSEVDYFLSYGKTDNIFTNIFSLFSIRLSKPKMSLQTVDLQKQKLFIKIEELVKDYISEPVDAKIIVNSTNPFDYVITTSTPGITFSYEKIAGKIITDWSILRSPEIKIDTFSQPADILEKDINSIVSNLENILSFGQIDIVYTDPQTKKEYRWYLNEKELISMLVVEKDDEESVIFSLDNKKILNFVESDIASFINSEPRDAKFRLGDNNKVTEFQASRPGIKMDVDEAILDIKTAFNSRNYYSSDGVIRALTIKINTVEPKIKTAEVNNLGISEILGIGYSNFKGSSNLRIKNIENAAYNKLHGLLIKPGEEFSLVEALKPFTTEAGYYPELVIKGDRVIPEMGGGLCQVGSTMFRTAMNSGLEITERRNHSLVVSYYNDARNGLPGTDATIYDPHPDFRFLNDTGNNILITSEVNRNTGELSFTLWGTSDGRKGYYSAPTVSAWYNPGPEKIIETTNLAPGVKECQNQYIGARASFVYTRILPEKGKTDIVYDSYYRPLPKTCLVGVEAVVEEVVEGDNHETEENLEDMEGSLEGDLL